MHQNSSLIDNHTIDVEINRANLNGPVNWNDVIDFFQWLTWKRYMTNEHIERAWSVYEPAGIDYLGYHNDKFEYNIFYFPFHETDEYKWMEPVCYTAKFSNHSLIGIHANID